MNTYNVKIIETLTETLPIEAENADEAEEIARRKYRNSEVILGAENHVNTDYLVTGSSEKLTNGLCTCGNNEFLVEEVTEATVLVAFADGEMTVVQGGDGTIAYKGLFKCKACGKSYEQEK